LHTVSCTEAFISKSVVPEVKKVLDETIKMVNYIKSRPLHYPRLFSAVFCHGSCSHRTPTAELDDLLRDETWCNKVAFLADISQALNTLNKGMQGKYKNILTLTKLILLRKN
jgi:hypothetical protein